MKFRRLVVFHLWLNPVVFGNNRPHRTADIVENVTWKSGFPLSFSWCGVFVGKTYNSIQYPISHRKSYIFIFAVGRPVPSKMVLPPKNNFLPLFWKILFFSEKIVKWKIFKTSMLTRKVTMTFVARRRVLLPSKWYVPQIVFRNFFRTAFFEKLV